MHENAIEFAAAFAQHWAHTCAVARRYLMDKNACEDVAQEVFAVLHRVLPRLTPDTNLAAWLTVATRNRARSWNRAIIARQRLERSQFPVGVSGAAAETQQIVRSLLSRLPPEQAVVITANLDLGLTCEEIAGRIQVPVGTVKTRLRRGLRAMRSI